MKRITIILIIFALIAFSYLGFLTVRNYVIPKLEGDHVTVVNIVIPKKEVIGFLPYWLMSRAQPDYAKYITTLTYFSLTVDDDGTIEKFTKPGESEPGYLALTSGKADTFLTDAKKNGVKLSLAVFGSDDEKITTMLHDPETSAKHLVDEVNPIMDTYGFTDLNIDIEQVSDASPEARLQFTRFVQAVKTNLNPTEGKKQKTISIDVTASSFLKKTSLTDPETLVPLVNSIIVMAYDYHYAGSFVTGPVAPVDGAGTVSELDIRTVIDAALDIMTPKKLILGIPLYGYGWETIGSIPRSATIPGSGYVISSAKVDDLLSTCATCSATFDDTDQESHIIYKDEETGTYHQIFFPDNRATQSKIDLAKKHELGGMAVWALGYEGKTILEPLSAYHN